MNIQPRTQSQAGIIKKVSEAGAISVYKLSNTMAMNFEELLQVCAGLERRGILSVDRSVQRQTYTMV